MYVMYVTSYLPSVADQYDIAVTSVTSEYSGRATYSVTVVTTEV